LPPERLFFHVVRTNRIYVWLLALATKNGKHATANSTRSSFTLTLQANLLLIVVVAIYGILRGNVAIDVHLNPIFWSQQWGSDLNAVFADCVLFDCGDVGVFGESTAEVV
jgi:hypothetical protein